MNSKICVALLNQVFISNEGEISPCCVSQSVKLENSRGSNCSTREQEFLRSTLESQTRRNMLNEMAKGRFPEGCAHCSHLEAAGKRSYRQFLNEQFQGAIFKGEIGNRELNLEDIEFLDIRFGNLCNLKCRMCSPRSSRLLEPEFREFFGANVNGTSAESSYENLSFDELKGLKRVNIAGGEPMISQPAAEFVKRLSRTAAAKEIKLTYNTNATHLDLSLAESWQKFREVEFVLSVDGYGELNDYIRYPSRWKKICENIPEFQKHGKIFFNSTIQIYNILELENLLCFISQGNHHINFNILETPEFLSIQAMPKELKLIATGKLEVLKERYSDKWKISALINYMNKHDNHKSFADFIKWTKFLDSRRSQSVLDVIPELRPFYV